VNEQDLDDYGVPALETPPGWLDFWDAQGTGRWPLPANGQRAILEMGVSAGFWDARRELAHIRQAAHARQRAPLAVLHVVLARVAASTSHTIELPAIVGAPVGLSYLTALLAPPGTGKGSASQIAAELLPLEDDIADLPSGSGEGIVEALFGWADEDDEDGKKQKVHRQVRHNAYVYIDEGQVLTELGRRSGATLLPTLRTIFTSGPLGSANASRDRHRIVPAGQYTYGIVVGFQPGTADALLADADAGTPQRFSWVNATDPNVPADTPDWPGPLDWHTPDAGTLDRIVRRGAYTRHTLQIDPTIAREVQVADLARIRGETHVNPLDAHRDLLRLKLAALLALLEQRVHVTDDDWRLAGQLQNASDTTRTELVAHTASQAAAREDATSERLARRQVHATERTHEWHVVEAARAIRRKVTDASEITVAEARRKLSRAQRELFEEALAHATDQGWVTEQEEPGHGEAKRTLRPGTERPR
jgi:hypothetical protein